MPGSLSGDHFEPLVFRLLVPASPVRLSFIRPMEPELVEQPPKRSASSSRVRQSSPTSPDFDFHALRSAITRRPQDLYLVAFDLLHFNGHDLRDMPLKDRREILQAVIPAGRHIQFSEALPGTGEAVYHLACEAGLEGIVSKRLDSPYRSGSTMNWRKIKCYVEKEMDIIGVKRETGDGADG